MLGNVMLGNVMLGNVIFGNIMFHHLSSVTELRISFTKVSKGYFVDTKDSI